MTGLKSLFLIGCIWVAGMVPALAQAERRPEPPPTRYDLLISPQDVERVSGYLGIRLTPKSPFPGAQGEFDFTLPRGRVLLAIKGEDVDPDIFAKLKKNSAFKDMYAYQVKGFGDDAYVGPAQRGNLYVFSFQKGVHWVTLTSGFSRRGGYPLLSLEQLRGVAEIILNRL